MRAVAQYATFTLTAPYASDPAAAHSRSATSRCTITSIRSICGTKSSRSQTSGVATLYGRLATSTHRGAAANVDVQSNRIASASTTVTFGEIGDDSRRAPDDATVDLDRRDRGARLGQRHRQRAEACADLDDMVAGPTSARRAILRTVLASATKFCPRSRRGASPCSLSSASMSWRGVHALPAEAHRHGRVGQIADRHEDVGVQHDVDAGGHGVLRLLMHVVDRPLSMLVTVSVRAPRGQRGRARALAAVDVPSEACLARGFGRRGAGGMMMSMTAGRHRTADR